MKNQLMSPQERRSAFTIALIYSTRMLGLFMIYPIFAAYAQHLPHSTPFLIGLALGIYGLTQAILQIPFGMLSDRIGRKTIITIGLVIFGAGSVVAASSHSIIGILIGRAIQGCGAVGSSLTALVADSTKDENRLKAMSIVGMTIGLSFTVAIIAGPLLNSWISVPGIFWVTSILALVAIVILWLLVPHVKQVKHGPDSEIKGHSLFKILRNTELLRLDAGIFLLHATLTATFLGVPLALQHAAGVSIDHQWIIYLPVMILSFFFMVPFIIIAEAKRKMKQVFCGAVLVLAISQGLLWPLHDSAIVMGFLLFFYFTAFIILEASLPSLVSKICPLANKGSALGIFSSSQFLGIFFGGIIGGLLFAAFGVDGTFIFAMILSLVWFIIAVTMKTPRHVSTKIFHADNISNAKKLRDTLLSTDGIIDAVVNKHEHTIYLKVDKQIVNEESIVNLLNEGDDNG